MNHLTRFSLKNSAVIIIASLLVVVGGLYSASELKRETMPDVSIPIVAVITPYPGAAPADVHDKISEPFEQAISRVDGIKHTNSVSSDSVSVIVAEFGYSADMDKAEADVLAAAKSVELPETALEPTTKRVSMGSSPILRFAVASAATPEAIQEAVRDELVPAIEAVDGVGEVSVSDERDDKVKIVFDEKKLRREGLTAEGVIQQLRAANLSFPVGEVAVGSAEEPVRVSGSFESVEELRDFQVAVYPDSNKLMGEAFAAIGQGMGQLGQGMGRLGGAVGQLGGAVGQLGAGVGGMGRSLGMQIGLTAALQEVQAQSLEAKIGLSSLQSTMRDLESAGATDTPAYQQAQAGSAQLSGAIAALNDAAASLSAQLKAAQTAAANAGAPQAAPRVQSSSGGSMRAPSAGAVDIGEPEISTVPLGDVAKVRHTAQTDGVFSRAKGEPAVLVEVVKTQDANTVDVSNAVREAVEEALPVLPGGATATYTYDGAININRSISDMVQEGLLGALFAFIVILVFLRNIRSTLIAAISIPLSIVLALLFMRFAGVTMNVMTLGGLTVAIGRVVDDSIVVIENIFNHLQRGSERTVDLVRAATSEVAGAITSSTLTTVAVFAPMLLVSGIVGKIFTPFALTVAVALLASLLVSLTIVPLLAKWWLLNAKVRERDEQATRTGVFYRRLLAWSLDHPGVVVISATLLFAGSLALIPVIGTGFMPPATEKFINVEVEFPPEKSPTDVDAVLRLMEARLAARDDVEFYTATVDEETGFNMQKGGVTSGNKGRVFARLEADGDLDATMEELRRIGRPFTADGARVVVSQVDMSGASANALDIVVTGPMEQIESSVPLIVDALEGVPGLENVTSNLAEKRPQVTVDVDQAAAASHGLNAAMVAGAVRGYVADQSAGTTKIDGDTVEILYRTKLAAVRTADDLGAKKLTTPLGERIAISDVADVRQVSTPVSIRSYDTNEYASVTGAITERDTSSVIKAAEERIDGLDLPSGVEVDVAGVAQMMSDSFRQLGIAMIVAVFAVYIVMVLTFGEAIAPLAIMFSLPLAVIGGVLGLFIAGIPLDMPAMIGVLMLIGIVTTNAIMFVERVHQRLAEGFERREALLDAGANRMRPILMTALTTIMALVPMASGFKAGALMSQSLAIVVVGGLATSTVLTLVVVPVVYDLLEALKGRVLRAMLPKNPAMAATDED